MIEDAKVARDNLVLEDTARRNINSLTKVGHDDDSSGKSDIGAKSNVSTDS